MRSHLSSDFNRIAVVCHTLADGIGAGRITVQRTGKKRLWMWVAPEFSGLESLSAPFGQELSLSVKYLNAAISLVGHIYPTFPANRDSTRHVKFAISGASHTPLAQQLAGGAEYGNLVPLSLSVVTRRRDAGMGKIDSSVTIQGNSTGKGRDRESSEEFAANRVGVTTIEQSGPSQGLLFDRIEQREQRQFDVAIDPIKNRFGRESSRHQRLARRLIRTACGASQRPWNRGLRFS